MAFTSQTRIDVYKKYNGHCAYCGCEIILKEMQVDHITPKLHGGSNDIENLNPSCRKCNFYKGCFTLEGFRNQLATVLKQNIEKPFQFQLGLKYGMVEIKEWDKQFYFEKLN